MNKITHSQIIQNTEHIVLGKNQNYLHIQIDLNEEYIHYINEQGFECVFSLTNFKNLSPYELYEELYSVNGQDIASISERVNSHPKWDNTNIGKNIGEVLGLVNIKEEYEKSKHSHIFEMINDFEKTIISKQWKYSEYQDTFYLIPHSSYCCKFNSREFKHLGQNNYLILESTNDKSIFFLNPYTMFEYYGSRFPENNTNVFIGYPSEETKNTTIIIRSSKMELEKALLYLLNKNGIQYAIKEGKELTISITLKSFDFQDILNNYNHKINALISSNLKTNSKYFSDHSKASNKIIIKPIFEPTEKKMIPIVEFVMNSTNMEAICELLISEIYPHIIIKNISTRFPNSIESEDEMNENIYDIPDEIFLNINTDENDN